MSPLPGGRYSDGAEATAPPSDRDLVERFWERVRMFTARRVRDAAAAEDLAQETLRRVSAALRDGKVENLQALPAFVFQTARNLCMQRDRSSARESRALARWGAEQSGEATGADPLFALVSEERARSVRAALTRLEPGDRQLLEQLYFDDAPSADVAGRLGVTPETLRVRKHRALRRLAAILGDAAPDVTPQSGREPNRDDQR
jgi:RNA polymerase sigma factor (sigma-70 family)